MFLSSYSDPATWHRGITQYGTSSVHVAGTGGAKVSAGHPGSGYPPILRNEIPPNNLREHAPIALRPMKQVVNIEELKNVFTFIYIQVTPLGI